MSTKITDEVPEFVDKTQEEWDQLSEAGKYYYFSDRYDPESPSGNGLERRDVEKVPDDTDMTQEEWDELDYNAKLYHIDDDRKKRLKNSHNRRKKEKREYAKSEMRERGGCYFCGLEDYVCIEWHHTQPENKNNEVSTLIGGGFSLEKVKNELEKCEPVCANCHKRIHNGKLEF